MTKRNATPMPGYTRSLPKFPKRHAIALGSLSIALSILTFSVTGEDTASKYRSQPLKLALTEADPIAPAPAALPAATSSQLAASTAEDEGIAIEAAIDSPLPPMVQTEQKQAQIQAIEWQTVKVRNGDSLSRIFQRVGLNDAVMQTVLAKCSEAADLKRIHPGEELSFLLDDNALQAIRYTKSPLQSVYIERDDNNGYTSRTVERTPEVRYSYREATIKDSLFLAGEKVDLPENIIMGVANIFCGVIDFVYDVRAGDSFDVLYEELYLDGEKINDGKILAAQFNNQGTGYPAFYYAGSDGRGGYYNEEGVSMRKAFLRAPVDFTRISSNFNPRRLHPIFKTKRPHRGIDYAAARGTPIYATGDGRIIKAGYSNSNGNYIVIQHSEEFVTKYLHLHRKQVKQGQRVKQGQIIGQVGSTGYATGPHLHYEFLRNGVHRDPRTIHKHLPKAESIAKAELDDFKAALQPIKQQLAMRGTINQAPLVIASTDLKNNSAN
jgi:murein DD-endopeptidase MepM/ murein hydrolase activator NlpD